MKKQIIYRALLGGPLGVLISLLITIGISYGIGDGNYYPVVPALIGACGNTINAVTVQVAASLLYGAVWGGASVIWETERWSLLRQTVTHLCIVSAATFPVAYFMRWMEHSAKGILLYATLFIGIYAFIWIVLVISIRHKLARINKKMRDQ